MESNRRSANEIVKINMHTVNLEQFEGPMDLLLHMIESQELNISEISLADVCDQYVQYVETHTQEISADELADFLVIASRLLILKVRLLLPYLHPAEEEEEESLEKQLKMYKLYYDAARQLAEYDHGVAIMIARFIPRLVSHAKFVPDDRITAHFLGEICEHTIEHLPFIRLPQEILKKGLNVKQRIQDLRALLSTIKKELSFQHIAQQAENKIDIIVSFIALLELVKQQEIHLKQDVVFEDITIIRR